MDFSEQLRAIATRIESTRNLLLTEEATKNACVMPFIQALGYNVFDPLEVTPELVADVGTKKGEKVDYAILKNGKPIIIFECKKCGSELVLNHASQLFRYFHVTSARFAVLTNGIQYRFFTDLEQPNKMDEKHFLEFNILDFKEADQEELRKFSKGLFDMDAILATANELKYTSVIRTQLEAWMEAPCEDFVKLVTGDLMVGRRFTPAIKEQFTALTRRAFQQLVASKINERLKAAMAPDAGVGATTPVTPATPDAGESSTSAVPKDIVTTTEEMEAFFIIKTLLRDTVLTKRIFLRDAQTYCSVLLDDNNRKPICRLRFNNPKRLAIGLFNGKDEEKVPLSDVEAIYDLKDRLKATAAAYLSGQSLQAAPSA